jgi:hypothetical protein
MASMKPPSSRTYLLLPLPRRLGEKDEYLLPGDGELLPIFVGGGGDNLLCGQCSFMIAQSVDSADLQDQKLFCPRCARENVIPRVGDLTALGQESYRTPAVSAERPSELTDSNKPETGRAGIDESPTVNI